MQNKIQRVILSGAIALVHFGCVNPPKKASGVGPAATKTPQDGFPSQGGEVPSDDSSTGRTLPTNRGPVPSGPAPTTEVNSDVKVSYWLNTTDNSNCLSIAVAGDTSPIAAPCTGGGRTSPQWVDKTFSGAAGAAFKATFKVDTTDKAGNKTTTSSDAPGDNAWRWRCVSRQDPVTTKMVHTVCYEDGNALDRVFDSSDLFVQIVGPSTVDLGSISCVSAKELDLVRCMGQ